MKKISSIFISFVLIVSLCGCSGKINVKKEYSLNDYTLYSIGVYSNGPLYPVYLTKLENFDIVQEEGVDWIKKLFSKKQFTAFDRSVKLSYDRTLLTKDGTKTLDEFSYDYYTAKDSNISAAFRKSDGKFVYYKRELSDNEIKETLTASEDQWQEKAKDVLREYVDLSTYSFEAIEIKSESKTVDITYRKYIDEIPTDDSVRIMFSVDGQVIFIDMMNIGSFDGIANLDIDLEEFEGQITANIKEAYKKFKVKETSYKIQKIVFIDSEKLALQVTISATATHRQNGEPIVEDLIDEHGEYIVLDDSAYVYLLFD